MTETPPLPLATQYANRWFNTHTFRGERSIELLRARKRASRTRVTVAIPTLNEASTIAAICAVVRDELMGAVGLVDELLVLDAGSTDGTARAARGAGAEVVDVRTVLPSIPFAGGKGESLWRSLAVVNGDVVVWVDGDIRNFDAGFVMKLIAPLLIDDDIDFVKGFYRRPIEVGGVLQATGGGRVTELLAKPLLSSLFPELSGFLQPLAGEYAGRTSVLRRVPFFSGYSVEAGLLIDLLDIVGLDGMAQADLGTRVHRNRPLDELGPMAAAIAGSIMMRAEERGRLKSAFDIRSHPLMMGSADGIRPRWAMELERPPISVLVPSMTAQEDDAVAVSL